MTKTFVYGMDRDANKLDNVNVTTVIQKINTSISKSKQKFSPR